MAHVWNIMNTLQIVTTFPLFSLKIPQNVRRMGQAFNTFANLEVVPKDEFYDSFVAYMMEGEEVEVVKEEEENVLKSTEG